MTTLSTKTRVIIDTDPGIDDAMRWDSRAKALDVKLILPLAEMLTSITAHHAFKLLKF